MSATTRARQIEIEYRYRQIEARQKYARLADFARASWPVLEPTTPLTWGWANDAICDHLEAVTRGQIKRLVINIAPRSTKSIITSIDWPAWSWLEFPSTRWLFSSYSLSLSIDLSIDCRRLIESKWYKEECIPDFTISGDQDTKQQFDNNLRGSRFATGMTAAAAGFGGDIVVADDPHNRRDANSPVVIKSQVDGWKLNISACLNDKNDGRMVVIMQRVCEGDLTDFLLEQGGWEHLCLPTEYDGVRRSTSLGQYDRRAIEGELLNAERFNERANQEAKTTLGVQGYSAQHAQKPTPSGGVLFDVNKFKKINADLIPKTLRKHRHWDLAATAESPGKDPDYTVGVKMGVDDSDGKIYVINVMRFRKSPADSETEIKTTAQEDGLETSITIEEEKASAGKHVASYYARRVLQGFIFRGQPIHGDKVARARAFAAQVDAGNVYVPADAEWLFDYFYELKSWPNSKHKDQGDGSSGAFNELMADNMLVTDADVFVIQGDSLRLLNGINSGAVIPMASLRDIGFISINPTASSIARVWLDAEGNCYVAEIVRRQTHPEAVIEELYRLHAKRPFESVGVEEATKEIHARAFEATEIAHIADSSPLPLWPIDLPANRPERHAAALQSAIATHKIAFADHLPRNGQVWSQIINFQSLDDENRDAIAGAVTLAQQSL